MTGPILEITDVSKRFEQRADAAGRLARLLGAGEPDRVVRALDRVSLAIAEGEVLGLVGESGCGKSTLGRIAAGLMSPTSGTVRYRGAPLGEGRQLGVQMIFQDPMSSLNPRLTVFHTLAEAAIVHGLVVRAKARDFVAGSDVRRRARCEPDGPVSAPVLRRPAPTHLHRARAVGCP